MDFVKKNVDNLGSIRTISFIDVSVFQWINKHIDQAESYAVSDFSHVINVEPEEGSFSSSLEDNLFQSVINFVIPKTEPILDILIDFLRNRKFVISITDSNLLTWVIGDLKNFIHIVAISHDSGASIESRNATKFVISNKSIRKPVYIEQRPAGAVLTYDLVYTPWILETNGIYESRQAKCIYTRTCEEVALGYCEVPVLRRVAFSGAEFLTDGIVIIENGVVSTTTSIDSGTF